MSTGLVIDIYPHDGPHAFTSTYFDDESAVPREGDALYLGPRLYRVDEVTWVYSQFGGMPTRAVVHVTTKVFTKKRRWPWNR